MNSQAPAVRHCTCIALALLLAFTLLTQGAAAAQRAVLGEQFTAEWCGYCPVVRTASSMLIDDFPDDLVMVSGSVSLNEKTLGRSLGSVAAKLEIVLALYGSWMGSVIVNTAPTTPTSKTCAPVAPRPVAVTVTVPAV